MAILRKLLLPFSLLYGLVTWIRNFLYNSNVLISKSYPIPVICVGNLNTGGTGKSPMIEYLLNFLGKDYRVASLSRGYKRKTKGYHLLRGNETAAEVGDEPLQFKKKFPNSLIAVDANRQNGIEHLLQKNPQVILLDDAFQHRKVKAGLNILLTSFSDLYADDFMLPTGNLREPATGAERADIIIVTKCPSNISRAEQERIRKRLELRNYQKLYFTDIKYSEEIFSEGESKELSSLRNVDFLLVTGIAKPKPLTEFLELENFKFRHLAFPDHHNFTDGEIASLNNQPIILTTEKDYMRLSGRIPSEKLYYLSIEVGFINNEDIFKKQITDFIA